RYGVTPDLTTFGKIIGGGMPVGAYGGRRELMRQVSPSGPVYQAGTLSGNPVAMAAGLAMLELVSAPGFHEALEAKTNTLCDGLEAAARDAGVPFTTTRVGGMFGLFFSSEPVDTYAGAVACDTAAFNRFFHAMLERGVYLAPSAFEAGFMSSAHGEAAIEATVAAAREAFAAGRGWAGLPAPGVRHRRPWLGRRQRIAGLQQLDRDEVRRAHEGHVAVARRPVDGHAHRLQVRALRVDVVHPEREVAEVAGAAVVLVRTPVPGQLQFRVRAVRCRQEHQCEAALFVVLASHLAQAEAFAIETQGRVEVA